MSAYFILGVDMDLTACCGTRHIENYALKILTAYATQLNHQGSLMELATLQAIASVVKSNNLSPHVPELVDNFETTGPHGKHICCVLRLRSTDVSTFQCGAPSQKLLLHNVKKVILHALCALEIIHEFGLIHTGNSSSCLYEIISESNCLDVKSSDILLTSGVEDFVTPITEGEIELQGVTYPLMKAQPLPHTSQWDDGYMKAEMRMFCLNDMGNGESMTIILIIGRLTLNCAVVRAGKEKDYNLGTPYALRAPEVILWAGYDFKIDIWAVGCMVNKTCFT